MTSYPNNIPLAKHFPKVGQLAYGCMGLGGGWQDTGYNKKDLAHTEQVIDTCLELGINLFDHADIYKQGRAEQVFGDVLKAKPALRDNMLIQSKCGIRFDDDLGPKRYDLSKGWITQSVEQSLTRLNCDYLDILLLHRPDPLMQAEEIAEAFSQLHASGKVKHFGVSNMHHHQLSYLNQQLDLPLVANQVEMSLAQHAWLDEGVLAGHPAGSEVNFTAGTLEYCRQHHVQLQAWGSLCKGLFSGRDVSAEPAHVQVTQTHVARLAALYQVSSEAILLAWLMRHPANIQPVIGTTNLSRIQACQQALSIELTREHWYQLYVSARGTALP